MFLDHQKADTIQLKEDNETHSTGADETDTTTTSRMHSFVDKITLEYMMNRQHYNNYISKTNPSKHKQQQQFQQKKKKFARHIEIIFNELMENNEARGRLGTYSHSIHKSFENFIENAIQHIEHMESIHDEDFYRSKEAREDEEEDDYCESASEDKIPHSRERNVFSFSSR